MAFDLKSWLTGFALGLAGKPLPISQGKEPIGYLYGHIAKEGETATHTIDGVGYVGAVLPNIDSVWTDELKKMYKYAYMYLDKDTSAYTLVVNSVPIYYIKESFRGAYLSLMSYFRYKLNGGVWEFVEKDGVVPIYIKEIDDFGWTNFDICTYEGDILYLAASEPIPIYE